MNIILIDVFAIVMFRIKRLTPMADKSATWRAVTEFRQTRSESLYHVANEVSATKADAPDSAATFTPAPTSTPTRAPDKPEKSDKPAD
jgi:hypothetical protein